jgi:hypothetical protein
VQLQWFDDLTSGIPVFGEDWYPFASSVAPPRQNTLAGCKPIHGQYLTITITNLALTAAIAVQHLDLFGSPRVVPYSDWRQNRTCWNQRQRVYHHRVVVRVIVR